MKPTDIDPVTVESDYWARAIAGVLPREGFLIGVTGGTGSGKTTLIDNMARIAPYSVVFPGKFVRATMSGHDLPDLGKLAPESTEDLVRAHILQAIKAGSRLKSVVIDGFPRSRAQFMWLTGKAQQYGYRVAIVVVKADLEVRRARVKARSDKWDALVAEKRFQDEASTLEPLLRWLPTVADVHLEIVNGIQK
jgi:dephospho-CoA kinase